MESTDEPAAGEPPAGEPPAGAPATPATSLPEQKFRPVHPGAWLATVVFALVGLASFLSLIGGLTTAQPASIITGAAILVVVAPFTAVAARMVRPVILGPTTVSVPALWGRRSYQLEAIAWIALIRSTGKSPAWWLRWWTDDGQAHSTPVRLAALAGPPDADLRDGRVAGSPAARAASEIYRQALAVQGRSGPLGRPTRQFVAEAQLGGARAFWSPDGTSGTLDGDVQL